MLHRPAAKRSRGSNGCSCFSDCNNDNIVIADNNETAGHNAAIVDHFLVEKRSQVCKVKVNVEEMSRLTMAAIYFILKTRQFHAKSLEKIITLFLNKA